MKQNKAHGAMFSNMDPSGVAKVPALAPWAEVEKAVENYLRSQGKDPNEYRSMEIKITLQRTGLAKEIQFTIEPPGTNVPRPERTELETLRAQIASLRALAKTWEDEANRLDDVAKAQWDRGTESATEFAVANGVRAAFVRSQAADITAIVGKE